MIVWSLALQRLGLLGFARNLTCEHCQSCPTRKFRNVPTWLERAFMQIRVDYSTGFNPHMAQAGRYAASLRKIFAPTFSLLMQWRDTFYWSSRLVTLKRHPHLLPKKLSARPLISEFYVGTGDAIPHNFFSFDRPSDQRERPDHTAKPMPLPKPL